MKMYSLPLIGLMIALSLFASACGFVVDTHVGNGVEGTETREVEPFLILESAGQVDLEVLYGSPTRIVLEGDENLIERMETTIRGEKLYLGPPERESFRLELPLRARVYVEHLDEVVLAGSGDVDVRDIDADEFSFSLVGSGDATLVGQANSLDVSIVGSGDLYAQECPAQDAEISLVGDGDVSVCAMDNLLVDSVGSGDIYSYCDSQQVTRNLVGSGRLFYR